MAWDVAVFLGRRSSFSFFRKVKSHATSLLSSHAKPDQARPHRLHSLGQLPVCTADDEFSAADCSPTTHCFIVGFSFSGASDQSRHTTHKVTLTRVLPVKISYESNHLASREMLHILV